MEKHPIMEQLSKAVAEKIVGINIDKTGNWWIRTPNAIYAYTKDLEPINNEKPIIKDLQINEIIEDREGGYWLATNGKGLYYMPNYQVMSYNESNSILEENWILDIETVDENTNLVFSKQGDIYEQENGKIRRIKSLGFNIETVKRAFDKNKIYIKRNKYKLLYLYNITKNTIEKIDYSLGAIKDLIETKDTLYIGNQSLFTAIDKSEKTSLRYTNSVRSEREHMHFIKHIVKKCGLVQLMDSICTLIKKVKN